MAPSSSASATDPNASTTDTSHGTEAIDASSRPSGIAPAGSSKTAPNVTAQSSTSAQSATSAQSGQTQPPTGAPPLPYRPFDFREAHAITAAKRAAIPRAQVLRPIGFDVPYAAKTAMGTATRLEPHRAKIAERFGEELAEIDLIDTYARAVNHAYVLLTTTTAPPEKVQAVYEAGLTARRFLSSDITNLVNLGFILPNALNGISGDAGHLNVANDIQKLVSIADRSGEAVSARLAITAAQRTEYLMLSYELVELASRRDSGGPTTEQARDDLDRAITLLVNAHDLADRVATYIWWENKAYREMVPSLYNNRPKSRGGNTAPEAPAPTPPETFAAEPEDDGAQEPQPTVAGARGGSPFAKDE